MKRFALILAAVVCLLSLTAGGETISAYTREVVTVTGTGCAIDYEYTATRPTILYRADILFSDNQSDMTALTMTLGAARGDAFNFTIASWTPADAEGSKSQFQLWPPYIVEMPYYLEPGDKLVFAYANAAGDTYGIRLVLNTGGNADTITQECPPEPEGEGEGTP